MSKHNELGKVLRKLREEKSLGIKSAAPKADVSYTYLSKLENGHKSPSLGLLKKLCQIYGANYEDIASLVGAMPKDIQEIIETHGNEAFDILRKTFGKDAKKESKGRLK